MRSPKPLNRTEAKKEFLHLLQGIVRDFPAHPENAAICVPRTFTPLTPLAKYVRRKIEPFIRTVSTHLFTFGWSFSPMSNGTVQINAIRMPDGSTTYWFLNDWHDTEDQHFLAGTAAKGTTDLNFLRLLFKRNGNDFGHELFGSVPTEIYTPLKDVPELPDWFLAAYQASPNGWDNLFDNPPDGAEDLDPTDPIQAREIVARHLRKVIA